MTNDQVMIGSKSKIVDQELAPHFEKVVASFATQDPKVLDYSYEDKANPSLFEFLGLHFNLEGVFLPSPDTNIPFESIFESWEAAFYEYILLPADELLELLKNIPVGNEGEDFLNVDWEKLFEIPLDPNLESYTVVTIAQSSALVSSLAVNFSLNGEGSLFNNQNFVQSVSQSLQLTPTVAETPKILVPFIPQPNEPIPRTPSFFPEPNFLFNTTTLPGGVAQQLINFLSFGIPSELNQIFLNTYSAIQIQGNLFSTSFNGDPNAAYTVGASPGQVDASLSALNIAGGSVLHTATSVILTTFEGNTLELFTAGSREGEFVYTIHHAIDAFADFASLPSLNTLFGPAVYTLDQFLYSVTNIFGNTNVGNLFFPVLNDKPVANNEGYDPSHLITVNEANILSDGSVQHTSPELVAGSLITPFVSNGILVISPDSTIVPITPSTAIQVNPAANGSYFGANGGVVSAVTLEGVSNAVPISTSSTAMTTFTLSQVLYLQSQGFTTANGYMESNTSDPVISIQDSLGNILLVDTRTSQYIYQLNTSFENTSPNASILPGMNDPAIVNFGFTLTDHQGQTASAQLGITVYDDAPSVTSSNGTVYESGLPNGSGTEPTTTILTGDFGVFGADDFDATNPISISLATIGATATAGGTLFSGALTPQFISIGSDPGISVTDSTNGNSLVINLNTLEYTYTLSSPLLFTTPIATQTYSLTFMDSDGSSANATFVVTITDDPPVLDNAGSTVTYVSGVTTEIVLEDGITLSDTFPTLGHNATNGAVISITDFFTGDQLNFEDQSGITGIYNSSTGVLELSGIASIEDYEVALRSITYSSTNPNPANEGTDFVRTISWVAFDSANVSSNIETTTVNIIGLPPEISNVGHTVTYKALAAPVIIESGITITSVDYPMLHGATVSITSGRLTGDLLNFTALSGITGDYDSDSGVLTLMGAASFTDYQTVLASVTYSSSNIDPTNEGQNLSRTITWIADDGQVTNNLSEPVTSVIEVRTPPAITADSSIDTYFAGDGQKVVSSDLVITAHETQLLMGATVFISVFGNSDVLAFDTSGTNISGSGIGVLTFTGLDSAAHYEQVLRSVTYLNNLDPTFAGSVLSLTFFWRVTDSLGEVSATATSTFDVRTPPVLTAGDTITYFAGDEAQVIDNTITVSTRESIFMTSAIVTISSGFDANDILAFDATGTNITGTYDSDLGILTLTGTDDALDYKQVLLSVTYESSSADPTNGGTDLSRTISWIVTDDLNVSSDVVTSTVEVRTPPTMVVPDFDNYIPSSNTPSALSGAVDITSVESDTISKAVIFFSSLFSVIGDVLHFSDQLGITGNYINGVLTLSGDASVSDYEAALSSITYSFNGTDPTLDGLLPPFRTLSWVIQDDLSVTNLPGASNSISFSLTPVVLDLSGEGINLVSANDSHQTLGAVIGTNHTQSIGWITEGQGLLMLNSNGDGTITNSNQISFTSYVPGAMTDLQGLTAFDSNHDNHFNANDAAFTEFGVLLANGHFDTLANLGIVSISLVSDNQFHTMNGNTIFGMTTYQTANGMTYQAADVGLMIGNTVDKTLQTTDIFPPQDNIDFTKLPALPSQGSVPNAPTVDTTATTITHSDTNLSSISVAANIQTIQSTTEQVTMPHPEPHPV